MLFIASTVDILCHFFCFDYKCSFCCHVYVNFIQLSRWSFAGMENTAVFSSMCLSFVEKQQLSRQIQTNGGILSFCGR